jgi:hypothetical protein
MGLWPFWRLVNDERFAATPAVLELPPELVRRNLRRLKSLVGAPEPVHPG